MCQTLEKLCRNYLKIKKKLSVMGEFSNNMKKKTTQKTHYTVGTVPNSNRKIVERSKRFH